MDFYSFSAYDFFYWTGKDFAGRVTSGLPLESVIDLIENYTHNTYGKGVPRRTQPLAYASLRIGNTNFQRDWVQL